VNEFTIDEKITITPLKVNPVVEDAQRKRLSELRQQRDEKLVEKMLEDLEEHALGEDNLMPIFIECVENKLTLGEICGKLREIWGEYEAPPIL